MIQTMNRLQLGGRARVGDVETHATVAPTLLDSLAEDLSRVDHDNERELIPGDAVSSIGVQSRSCAEREADECSSAQSESCWGEMEDIGDDEVAEWGTLSCPTSLAHAIPGPHGVDCDRVANHAESQRGSKKKRLLLIRNSQNETVAAFGALDDDAASWSRDSKDTETVQKWRLSRPSPPGLHS